MAGAKCPKCGELTFFNTPSGRKCSNTDCNYEMKVPPNDGKGGKGLKCPNCGTYTVFNSKCTKCGAVFS